jgi:hypothetical protein
MSSKFKIKRDISTVNAPHPNQLEVGELALNAVTGKLYTKLVSGKIVEYNGQLICAEKTPTIFFSDVSSFCCFGDLLTVTVRDLKDFPVNYQFEIEDLSNNQINAAISTPIYNSYVVYPETSIIESVPIPINLREAIVPISISISGSKNISVLKFKVLLDNNVITERTISISCRNC